MTDPRRHFSPRWDRFVAIAFVVALAVPGLALLAGLRPPELENRAELSLPALDSTTLTDPETYKAIDDYVARNLPARDIALNAYATLDYDLLRGSTDPTVVLGRGDWLFFLGELQPKCPVSATALVEQWDAVSVQAEQAKVQVRFVIAPDKHAIYPDRLPPDLPIGTPCTDAGRDEIRAGMAARPDLTVDLWTAVLAESERAESPLYFSQDSHWTPTGAMAAIAALVESLEPGVWDPTEITISGTSRFPMELARLMGKPRDALVPRYVLRPKVKVQEATVRTPVDLGNARDVFDYTTSGTESVVPGTTLVVYDSFFNINRLRIAPWFKRTVWVHAGDLRDHPELVDFMPPIDTIVLERVERGAYEMNVERLLHPVLAPRG